MTAPGVGSAGAPLVPVRASTRLLADGAVPIRPVAPIRPAADSVLPDLQRMGVDLPTLLDGGADALLERGEPGTAALGDVLERARGALVRGAPMEVLAALDAGWAGASRTESGWYFRGAALMLLGLPGEATRVLQQAVGVREGSAAVAFLQSVASAVLGDFAYARTALANATHRRPGHPLLRAWEAVLGARVGHFASAQATIDALADGDQSEAVITWARQAIMRARAESQRGARLTGAGLSFAASESHHSPTAPLLDPVDVALQRLGARLGTVPREQLRDDVRQLLRSLSASGALQDAGRSERAHAVRTVLATLHRVAGDAPNAEDVTLESTHGHKSPSARTPLPLGSPLDAYADDEGSWRLTPVTVPSVAPDLLARTANGVPAPRLAVLNALRAGELGRAEQLLGHASASEGDAVVRVLRRLLEGAVGHRVTPDPVERSGAEPTALTALSTAREETLLAPLRFGLMLLQELSPRREARAARSAATPPPATGAVDAVTAVRPRRTSLSTRDRPRWRVWGAACLLLAVVALQLGHGPVALVLAGAAAWLLLR